MTLDMRSLSAEERRLRRLRVMELRAAGTSYAAIAAQTGLSRTGVFDICKRIAVSEPAALDDAPNRGRRSVLDDRQATLVRALIADHPPDELALPSLLWTPAMVTLLIERRTGLRLSVRNTALKLRDWGFGPPRPFAKARRRHAAAAERWLANVFPAVLLRAHREGAELGWLDVSPLGRAVANTAAATPTALRSRPVRSVFSTVDRRGRMRWAAFAGPLDAANLIDLLNRRIHDMDRKIVLILDPVTVRRSAPVRAWLAEHEDSIEIVDLPRERGALTG